MTAARNPTPLAARLLELGISPAELSELVHRSEAEVEGWIAAESLGGEAAVLCRFLASTEDAQRRVGHLRGRYKQNLQGDGFAYADLPDVPYGTGDVGKVTGGGPQ